MLEVNLTTPMHLSALAAQKMVRAGGGSIVNIASVQGPDQRRLQGRPGQPNPLTGPGFGLHEHPGKCGGPWGDHHRKLHALEMSENPEEVA